MKVAVTYENGEVFQHFGHTEQFKIYTIEDKKAIDQKIVNTMGSGHGALATFLQDMGIEALICGGIGQGARSALDSAKIAIYPGVSGNADEVVEAFLKDRLQFNPDTVCEHHHDENHESAQRGDSCQGHDYAGDSCKKD
jgi:predicted Fe-Mo cluster-binding NifX family protein